ncbi:hypothetical protein [Streptomyces sp. KHY 26]|uniref:hypothetical protein n=1 Tax=Streptomyces sp. KHY 26 TaxID=3097359 RepID=UPI00376EDA1C
MTGDRPDGTPSAETNGDRVREVHLVTGPHKRTPAGDGHARGDGGSGGPGPGTVHALARMVDAGSPPSGAAGTLSHGP